MTITGPGQREQPGDRFAGCLVARKEPSLPPEDRVLHCAFRLEPLVKGCDDRLRLFAASRQSHFLRARAIRDFDVESLAEVRQRGGRWIRRAQMTARFELVASMHPATCLNHSRSEFADPTLILTAFMKTAVLALITGNW